MFSQSTSSTFNGGINVAFINITSYTILQQQRPKPKSTPRHNVFAFLIPALFNGGINVAFINITSYTILQQQRPKPKSTPRHNVFAFLIPALFNFLDLEYQGNGIVSPFQTHPKTMCVALVCLLSYYTAYEAEKEPRFTQLGRLGMGLFGSILAVSLASVLCQNSVSCVVCFLYVLFSNREMLSAGIDFFWNWIQQKSTSDPLQEIRLINRLCYICPSLFTGEAYSQCNSLDGS